ncbi:MAG: 23S rRNA (uracil(1939)-C(5))-methyltransferase RlmD [Gammaproteobacteria bacterium]|nr:23S rRNA (uracil(1939)-C(5))-methyltransferase RlmD [Gammaproteobacteria bacterium]
MAQNKRRRRVRKLPDSPVECLIEGLSTEGRGIVHLNDKVVFVDGALPGEKVEIEYTSSTAKYDEAKVISVLEASADRVVPPCQHADICGGCSLQHLNTDKQIENKQAALIESLQFIGKVQPDEVLPVITGPVTGYRYKARLGVRYVAKKERVLVGFREKRSNFLALIDQCEVLHIRVGHKLSALADLILGMDAREQIPQIEVAIDDSNVVLVFRHLEALSESDLAKLVEFAKQENFVIMLQPGGHKTVHNLWPEDFKHLSYKLKDQGIQFNFDANDFTQVNPQINQKMINRVIELLDIQPDEKVLDLFCGLGNFTLPLAQKGAYVIGIEGSQELVNKAVSNAVLNNISNVEFHAVDLSTKLEGQRWLNQSYDKILLDPPRSGAMEMIHYLGKLGASRIVYVSCQPTTLARDAGVLVNDYGYRMLSAGVMDMFPHTAHVESIAVFEK